MQNTLTFLPPGTPDLDVGSTFNVVIAYEDFDTGKYAKKTYDYLVEHLNEECQFTNQMWKFDVLAVTKLREMAAKDAGVADIIMISTHGTNDLPDEVKAWFELWLVAPRQTIALVGLFETTDSAVNPARAYLQSVAERAKVEFFSQPGNWPGKVNNDASQWERNEDAFSVLADVVQQRNDQTHWGINE